ncbi:MAG: extracellular solute-binding protein [Clostridiales bacterium]|nr:extracellular solute-binding protein [Clostridiales bacterium]
MKKVISTLLSALMLSGCVAGFAACDGAPKDDGIDAKYKYDITVWVGEDTSNLTKDLITKFNTENTNSIYFNAKVIEVTESKAAGDILSKPSSAPEIFCFAQDQIARLVSAGLLAAPSASIKNKIVETHSETAVAAATMGTTLYAYPLTEDNGYFLYYDNRLINETQADSIESIIEVCKSSTTKFSFGLNGGWYVSSFFYAAGAHSEWTVDDQGRFTDYDDTFNSAEGKIAAKGLQKVLKEEAVYSKNGAASDFNAAIPAAAVVSGIWDYNTAKNALSKKDGEGVPDGKGDYLGIAKLPTYTVDDESYRLKSYLGSKLLGVSPQTNANKSAALSILAQYLTNAESQLARYKAFGWGPSAKTAKENADVKADVALNALKETATVPQGQYPANWWAKPEVLSASLATATSDLAIDTALSTYAESLSGLLD